MESTSIFPKYDVLLFHFWFDLEIIIVIFFEMGDGARDPKMGEHGEESQGIWNETWLEWDSLEEWLS